MEAADGNWVEVGSYAIMLRVWSEVNRGGAARFAMTIPVSTVAAIGSASGSKGDPFTMRGLESTNFFVDVAFVPTASAPFFSIVLNPANPTIPTNVPKGSLVAAVIAERSDGSPFTGMIAFVPPNLDTGCVYALDSNHHLILNPIGPRIGSVQSVTLVATE